MATIEVSDHRTRAVPLRWVSVLGSLTAAGLFLGSAVLQFMASLQRWVVFRGSLPSENLSAEDHLYDYSFPHDPWRPIGTAAELYGTGILLVALGVLAMPLGLSAMTRIAGNRIVVAGVIVSEVLLAILVAGSFGVGGAHALISGFTGIPSPLQHSGALGLIGILGLAILAAIWRASRPAMIACMFLKKKVVVHWSPHVGHRRLNPVGGSSCDAVIRLTVCLDFPTA